MELIALQTELEAPPGSARELTLDELLAARLIPPPGVGPVSLEDMERAFKKGQPVEAVDTNVLVRSAKRRTKL